MTVSLPVWIETDIHNSCTLACPDNCKKDICDKTTGACADCDDGYWSTNCDEGITLQF